jgi:class 3 adenylate cyclase/tetratricopeptide (TPR) repeat protein
VTRERKVVTSLFCDLVGFTTMSEDSDPEDVQALMSGYFAAARSAIEAFGGVVEKFIGDAVLGVFGVPAAHEDDPERAVRAGLRIVDAVEGLTRLDGSPLQLRVGVETGEVLVRLDVAPGSGEGFVTGDAINTAARIQSVSPVMGVAVGGATFDATRLVFDYRELAPATVKGKSAPVRVWQAVSPLARLGTDVTRRHDSPLVGREKDVAVLTRAFDRACAARALHLVTIVGEPGLGKSRLIAELFGHLDSRPELVTWRQGRCLPYGDGITFWALGEIVKAHAGILETDAPDVALARLEAVLPDTDDRGWLKQRLLPLLGIEASSRADQGELFAAWCRYLESVAQRGPTVLVFEDLHWADPAFLGFLEHLAGRATQVPLLILATTRPELFDTRPDFQAGFPNATTIRLAPLTEDQTTRLVAGLLSTLAVPDELAKPLLKRAGGNPLFAEEYVRLIQDQDLVEHVDGQVRLRPGADLPLPSSVHAVLSARLDTLPPDHKALLADAAVLGKVFWVGAVAALSGAPDAEVTGVMKDLARNELIRPVRSSSMAGQAEYTFWHVLMRDVAYAQLPRAWRAARHAAAADWIEELAGDRAEDFADVLAHHAGTALDLAVQTGDEVLAERVRPATARFLLQAGERALRLDATAGFDQLERAVTLVPDGDPLRGRALAAYGKAAFVTLHPEEARHALEQAVDVLREAGDVSAAVDALFELAKFLRGRGDSGWSTPYAPMLELVDGLPPGPVHVRVYTYHAALNTLLGVDSSLDEESLEHQRRSVEYADRALTLAAELGLDVPAEALGWRGNARFNLGDPGGIDDIREAITLATPSGQRSVVIMYNNLASAVRESGTCREARRVMDQGIAYADAHGITEVAIAMRKNLLMDLLVLGETDELLAVAEQLEEAFLDVGDPFSVFALHWYRTAALLLRGEAELTRAWLPSLLGESRTVMFGEADLGGLALVAVAYADLGERDAAVDLFTEVSATVGAGDPSWTRTLIRLGELELAERLVPTPSPTNPYAERELIVIRAALAEARGEYQAALSGYVEAVRGFHEVTWYVEEAFALLGQGRCLQALRRAEEASPVLESARSLFATMGARAALTEVESLLTAGS